MSAALPYLSIAQGRDFHDVQARSKLFIQLSPSAFPQNQLAYIKCASLKNVTYDVIIIISLCKAASNFLNSHIREIYIPSQRYVDQEQKEKDKKRTNREM